MTAYEDKPLVKTRQCWFKIAAVPMKAEVQYLIYQITDSDITIYLQVHGQGNVKKGIFSIYQTQIKVPIVRFGQPS